AWALPGGDPSHVNGHLALSLPLERAWSADIGSASGSNQKLLAGPVVADGRVFVPDATGHVAAFDAASGRQFWRVRAASPREDSVPLGGGVGYDGGRVFVTTGFGEVLALDPANGGLIWRNTADGPLRAPPTAFQGRVYAVTVDNQTEAFDAATGEALWTHTGLLETAGMLGGAAPAIGPGIVVVPYSSGEVYGLRQESGLSVWSDSLAAVRRVGALASLADIQAEPVADDRLVLAISQSGRMAAIDPRSGGRAWEQDLGGIEMPWVAGDTIFVVTNEADLVALELDTGGIRWVTALPRWEDPEDREGPIVWHGPVLAGGRLIVVGSDGEGLLVDPAGGGVAGRFDLDGEAAVAPVVAGGILYVLTDNGRLTAYR
ncbi:MAG: PQQ-binding-like beta-propeller repeat protein, partial [Alphaproteobacteria bacterium]|nr:PQQ-binding-like beta-propeller repeat protein [Alphaproteobacteria bacterium]